MACQRIRHQKLQTRLTSMTVGSSLTTSHSLNQVLVSGVVFPAEREALKSHLLTVSGMQKDMSVAVQDSAEQAQACADG